MILPTISNDEGIFISHSTNVQPKILTGLLNGDLPNWLISMESVPELGLTVSMGIKKDKAFKVINHLLLIGIGVLVVAVAFSMLVLSIIASSISKPIKNLVMWTERLSMGDLTLEDIKITNDEVGELNVSYRKVVNSLQEAASVCDAISNGDFSRSLEIKSYKVNRICETKDCTTRLSIYNKDTICDACHTAIPLENLPYKNIAKFL